VLLLFGEEIVKEALVFAHVTTQARRKQVAQGVSTALGDRNDVIEGNSFEG